MAKCGNHGIIIPRNVALLHDLYWVQDKSLTQIAAMYGVTHKSVERVFRKLNIPRHARHTPGFGRKLCIDCGEPAHKLRHAKLGVMYGRRCEVHQKAHMKALNARLHREGPANPKGELQWINKSKALLRKVNLTLLDHQSREV